jgi:isocitrate dehydrogenase
MLVLNVLQLHLMNNALMVKSNALLITNLFLKSLEFKLKKMWLSPNGTIRNILVGFFVFLPRKYDLDYLFI